MFIKFLMILMFPAIWLVQPTNPNSKLLMQGFLFISVAFWTHRAVRNSTSGLSSPYMEPSLFVGFSITLSTVLLCFMKPTDPTTVNFLGILFMNLVIAAFGAIAMYALIEKPVPAETK